MLKRKLFNLVKAKSLIPESDPMQSILENIRMGVKLRKIEAFSASKISMPRGFGSDLEKALERMKKVTQDSSESEKSEDDENFSD